MPGPNDEWTVENMAKQLAQAKEVSLSPKQLAASPTSVLVLLVATLGGQLAELHEHVSEELLQEWASVDPEEVHMFTELRTFQAKAYADSAAELDRRIPIDTFVRGTQ